MIKTPAARVNSVRLSPAPAFAVVLPCYNEEQAVLGTLEELTRTLAAVENYELIVVNDGSTDRTGELLRAALPDYPKLRVFNHPQNRGYGASLKTGIRLARAELIVITDADGTYPNERIPELVEHAKSVDMVVGSRTAADVDYPFIRKVPKAFLRTYASWIAGQNIPDLNSGMRVFRRRTAESLFHILPNGFSFTTTITLSLLTNQGAVKYVPISYKKRVGRSKIKPIRDTLNFLQLIVRTGMYFAPFRVLMPLASIAFAAFLACFLYDWWALENLTDKTLGLFMLAMNIGIMGLLADMISKRSGSAPELMALELEAEEHAATEAEASRAWSRSESQAA